MKILNFNLDKLQDLNRGNFEKIKESEFRPTYDLMGMKYLRDKAGHERNLRELYRNRAPYELLQNADDVDAQQVLFIMTNEGMAFIHDGRWFTLDNFRSLADGWSDKDPNESIGHKGLGFRSVLDITPSPYLVKVDKNNFFAVKFTWALNHGHIQKAINQDKSLQEHYDQWTKHGQLACPVMAIPGLAKKNNLGIGSVILDKLTQERYGNGFTTMFWFPSQDPDIDKTVLEELIPNPVISNQQGKKSLINFIENEVSVLLPFLSSIKTVTIYENDNSIASAHLSSDVDKETEREITVDIDIGGKVRKDSFFQIKYDFLIPERIKQEKDTPKAVKSMEKAKVILSTKLKDRNPVHDNTSCFHVYFPTEETTGVGFVIHGDFYVKPDRTRIMGGDYNNWLLDCAAKLAADKFLTILLERYSPNSVFSSLSPTNASGSADENFLSFFTKYLKSREKPFVPTINGLQSQDIVLLPPQIDDCGFWEEHFSSVISRVTPGKEYFLSHEEDSARTRSFLHLTNLEILEPERILDFIETSVEDAKPSLWWYDCYSYLANDDRMSRYQSSFFINRKLIMTTGNLVIAIPEKGDLVVCMPPIDTRMDLHVPECFSHFFVFIDSQIAKHLQEGEDGVRNWILNRFQISRFEASDLLPRAIRGVVSKLYNQELPISYAQLKKAWLFIKEIIDISRAILSSSFWQEVVSCFRRKWTNGLRELDSNPHLNLEGGSPNEKRTSSFFPQRKSCCFASPFPRKCPHF